MTQDQLMLAAIHHIQNLLIIAQNSTDPLKADAEDMFRIFDASAFNDYLRELDREYSAT